jgi:hypothetical protein
MIPLLDGRIRLFLVLSSPWGKTRDIPRSGRLNLPRFDLVVHTADGKKTDFAKCGDCPLFKQLFILVP